MSTNDPFERMVAGYLASGASEGVSDRELDGVLSTTSRMRPYPRWLADIKETPMRIPSRVVVGSPTFRLATILALTLALLVAIAGAVVAGASMLPSPAPRLAPYGPAANGSLLFAKDGDIYLADADGTDPRAIITHGALDNVTAWFSHDGTRIAVGHGVDGEDPHLALWVANADGSNMRELLPAGGWNAEFMPSDTEMVATRWDGDTVSTEHTVLSMIDVATGAIRDLDLGGLEPIFWQMPRPPDGREIIFAANTKPGGPDHGLYAIRPDGTGLRAIGALATTESEDQQSFADPVLSPDGSTVLFHNWEPNAERAGTTETSGQYAHVRDLDTGAELPVAFRGPGELYADLPRFSPDGKMVVFESHEIPTAQEQLFYGPMDGSEAAVPIGPTYSWSVRQGFDFSPDGTKVLLSMNGFTRTVDVATGETTELADIPSTPSWQRVVP